MNKLLPIVPENIDDIESIFDECNTFFKETILNKGKRPLLDEREVFIPIKWMEDKKSKLFWHICSIEPKNPNLSILPCTNDAASSVCEENCINLSNLIHLDNKDRAKCIYRAVRIAWIKEIIELYNSNDPRVKYWEKLNSDKKNRIYLRFQEDGDDYVIVFERKSVKRVVLVTAYPVFYRSSKYDYDVDYNNYQQQNGK